MKIALPDGYQPPDNAQPGEPFEVVATVVQTEDGTFDLTAIDGQEVTEDETDEEPAEGEESPETKLAAAVKIPWGDEENSNPA